MTDQHRSPLTPDGSVFFIDDFEFADGRFAANFRGDILGEQRSFTERFDFGQTGSDATPSAALLRLLALASSLSYFKATRADVIEVAFGLTDAERHFFATLIEHGLGEYAFVNDALFKLTPRIEAASAQPGESRAWDADARPLVAVGGGKDSIVTIEALRGQDPLLFSVNDRGAIGESVEASGFDYLTVFRTIDPELIQANRDGAPNGHVPVTAINSAIALVTAELTGSGPVVFSNEASADYGNLLWHGRNINHQWSKSLAFEDLLRQTLAADGLQAERYFSLLRSYPEIEIARAFARHPQYFGSFTSCNRAYVLAADENTPRWCGECAKCAFVFLILAPFIGREKLVGIFGTDMLDREDAEPLFVEVLGLGSQKPFDCVGEPAEAVWALHALAEAGDWDDSAVFASLLEQAEGLDAESHRGEDRVPAAFLAARDSVGAL